MTIEQPSYRAVLGTQYVARTFLASIIGQLSMAMSGLALVLLLQKSTGSFAISGAVTAALGIAKVVTTPWRARLIDRRGQFVMLSAQQRSCRVAGRAGLHSRCRPSTRGVPGRHRGISLPPFATTMRVLLSAAMSPGELRRRGVSLHAVAGELRASGRLPAGSAHLTVELT